MSKDKINISGIFYMGNKRKLIKQGLINLFPNNIDTFVDLFGGSGIVGMNTKANRHIVNDIDNNLFNFYTMFKNIEAHVIIAKILSNVNNFGMKGIGVPQKSAEAPIYKERYIKMRSHANETKDIIDLYSCIFYAFSQQMRFNQKGDFNMPFGNGAFTTENENYIRDTCSFFKKANIYNKDFRDIKLNNLKRNDFVYMDCPYLNTTATYNENNGWKIEDDFDLFHQCEEMHKLGIKWGMSNVFSNKGIVNEHLIQWCEKHNWKVYHFENMTYSAMGKGNSNAKEVYICNYEGEKENEK